MAYYDDPDGRRLYEPFVPTLEAFALQHGATL